MHLFNFKEVKEKKISSVTFYSYVGSIEEFSIKDGNIICIIDVRCLSILIGIMIDQCTLINNSYNL